MEYFVSVDFQGSPTMGSPHAGTEQNLAEMKIGMEGDVLWNV